MENLQLQYEVMERMDSFAKNYGKTPAARFTLGYLDGRKEGLVALWAEFVANHKAIMTSASADERKIQSYFIDDLYSQYEDLYFDLIGRMGEKRSQLSAPLTPPIPIAEMSLVSGQLPTTSSGQHPNPAVAAPAPDAAPAAAHVAAIQAAAPPAAAAPAAQSSGPPAANPFAATGINAAPPVFAHHIQIPRLNVPAFNGAYEDWPSFRDLYVVAVHSNPTLPPVHKLQYLKSLLTGPAESILKHIPTTSENYVNAWTKLEERFDNKRALMNNTLRKLFTQRPVDDTAVGIRLLLDNTRECIGALHVHGVDTRSWDPILIYIISQSVPATTLDLWEQSILRNQLPTIDQLLEFLESRFRILEFSAARTSTPTNRARSKPQAFHTAATPSACRLCQAAPHSLRTCPKFLDMQPSQRLSYVTKAKLCRNCFAYSHQTQSCKSLGTCNVCHERHHSLLHLAAPLNRSQPASSSSAASSNSASTSGQAHASAMVSQTSVAAADDVVLATALIVIKSFDGESHTFRALLDNGSQENFVSRRLVQFLGIRPAATSMTISGIGQTQAPKPLGQVNFTFGSLQDSSFSMEINAIVLPHVAHTLPSRTVMVNQKLVTDLNLADPSYGTPGSIDVLLSANVFADLTLPSVRKRPDAPTVALQTKLGWVIFGAATSKPAQTHRTCFHVSSEDRISAALQEFWRIEEVSSTPPLSPDDERCEQIYATTHTRTAEGRYCVQLPFKQNPPSLGSSRDQAVSRFLQVERKFASNPQLREDYSKCINEYLQLGHMRLVTPLEGNQPTKLHDGTSTFTSYYLPHHAVIKMESSTTKCRVVFDASSKTSNGTSLNDAQLIGPVLQDSLVNLLTRWRAHRIVIKADIAKMYRQVLVAEQHQPYQRIIWRNSPAEPLQDFQLQTVTFGTAAAPYLAIKTLQQLAVDETTRFPLGSQMLKMDFYVDDLLSGADTVSDAIEMQRQAIQIMLCGGFEIRKWSSNCPNVTEQLDDDARELCSGSQSTLKTLGILWRPSTDTLSIKVSSLNSDVSTKRALLSEVSKLFDPLGWIAPTIIVMKMLLQQLWLAGLSWDEPLPASIQAGWTEFQRQLPAIESIAIPRWTRMSPKSDMELHGFCDASEKAYAAAVYIRVRDFDGNCAAHLVTAKTRVAPVKQLSLPRLELCGAVLLSKLLTSVLATFPGLRIHAWTDSEIVLAWLQGHPNRWKTFVANRIAEIHNTCDAGCWHHVPSKDNPADCASRGIAPDQLPNHPLWWHGPAWLTEDEAAWPHKLKHDIPSTQLECKQTSQSFVATIPTNDTINQILNDSSTLTKATRLLVLIRRWFTRPLLLSAPITVAEMLTARNTLVRHTQQLHFADEFKHLTQTLPLPKSSKLLSLNPFVDDDQLLRVGGRLQNADIPYPARHPIIMPRKSRLTELLIDDAHRHTLHGSIALMQTYLRTQYWIVDSRNVIRHQVHKCNTCFRYLATSLKQLMGQLPAPRVNIAHPFAHTGIDYAGPFSILQRRSPGRPQLSKGYICLFVCLATKAIHIELVGDMTANTFLAALNRFIARRGLPSDLYSDNGTYFNRAATDIDLETKRVIKAHTADAASSLVHKAIQWHFIPPAAPHFGGLWEAGVKSTKYHLKRIIGDGLCTYEELTTILCQIEGCLNSRPLCPVSSNPDDFEILTPGHFLIGRPLCSRPQPSVLETPTNRLTYWQRILQTTERFWKQWQSEYLSRLQQRPKWTTPSPNIQVGELVLLKEDNSPPAQWKVARITEVHTGPDDQVRVVTLKTPTSILKRPITKICRLPSQ